MLTIGYRLQKVWFCILFWGIMVGTCCEMADAAPLLPEPPLPPGAHWEMAAGDRESDWQIYLTGSDVSGIAVDGNVLWAASSGGLLRWERDTGVVTQYLAPAFPLPSNSLSQVLLHTGKLYISGKDGVAIFDRHDEWTLYTNADIGMPIGYHAPLAMVEDVLWVVGEEGIVHLYPDGHWEHSRYGQDGLPEHRITEMLVREDDVYIVIALGPTVDDERRVLRLNDGVWEEVDDPTVRYFETPDGTLWKGQYSELFKSTDGGQTWTEVLGGDLFMLLAVDADGRLYVASDDTILIMENDEIVERYCFTDIGPELKFINIIQVDEQGRMWIATDGRGLTMFDGERWYNWQDSDAGMRKDCIRGMAIGNGKVYAGTHGSAGTGGVNVLDIETLTWTNFWPGESELSGGGVDGIAVDDEGRVYFPTSEGILDIFDHGTWEHIPIPFLPDGHIFGFSEAVLDLQGNYWVGIVGFGLYRYDGQNWTIYEIPGGVTALELDAVGRLWVGMSDGLVVRDVDERWFLYMQDKLPAEKVWIQDIAVDSAGRAWIITIKDLLVFNGQEWRSFSYDDVGASMWGEALGIDVQGNVWAEAGWGLVKYQGQVNLAPLTELDQASQVLPEALIIREEGNRSGDRNLTGLVAVLAGGLCLVLLVVLGGVGGYFLLQHRKRSSEATTSVDAVYVEPDDAAEVVP